ncbi:ErpL protein [Borreliella valaisiana]|uniref:ErpL protein n=1 Tax=Borreliella valaisiana TaxID=62088 RepID=UPI001AEF9418|nr:ErpL protein [Borreliella valaisiana]
MNKKMFIICVVFTLISSCKNYASGEDLKGLLQDSKSSDSKLSESEQDLKKQVKGFLDILDTKDLSLLDTKEIENKVQNLKEKIGKSNSKKTSLVTYFDYEELTKQLGEKFKSKGELKNQFKGLEDILETKKEERKKELEKAKQKFEEFKKQVDTTTGVTYGNQTQNQGRVGVQAWNCAKELGLNVSYSSNTGTDTNKLAKKVVDDALSKIEEELKKLKNKKE